MKENGNRLLDKKKILLMITLMLSFIVFIGEVDAAKELTCVYDNGSNKYIEIIQFSDGSRKTYSILYNEGVTPNVDTINDGTIISTYDLSDYQDESELDHCFKYYYKKSSTKPKDWDKYEYKIKLSDKKENNDYKELVDSKEGLSQKIESSIIGEEYNYDDEASSGKWSASCIYKGENSGKNIYLFFNKDLTLFVNEDNKSIYSCVDRFEFCKKNYEYFFYLTGFSLGVYYHNGNPSCPSSIIYIKDTLSDAETGQGVAARSYYYFTFDIDRPNNTGIKEDVYVYQGGNNDAATNIYEDCESLIGEEAVALINNVMKWIRIIVPILLIVFGVLDFSQAIFSSNEENIKKIRTKFFKRIIAAVLVFLAPLFVNLIMEIANQVWDVINADTCLK